MYEFISIDSNDFRSQPDSIIFELSDPYPVYVKASGTAAPAASLYGHKWYKELQHMEKQHFQKQHIISTSSRKKFMFCASAFWISIDISFKSMCFVQQTDLKKKKMCVANWEHSNLKQLKSKDGNLEQFLPVCPEWQVWGAPQCRYKLGQLSGLILLEYIRFQHQKGLPGTASLLNFGPDFGRSEDTRAKASKIQERKARRLCENDKDKK